MKIETLRKLAGHEEVDYLFLQSALKKYARPRDKISSWIESGDLIRVKKGLYIFGRQAALQPYSKEALANLIYGPSAISLSYALSYYGLIPERVHTVTSITNTRNKTFSTAVGEFKYYYLHPRKYAAGIQLHTQATNTSFLMATPEKALCDQIHIANKTYAIDNEKALEKYLFHYLRIDELSLKKLTLQMLKEICSAYSDKRILLLCSYIKSRK